MYTQEHSESRPQYTRCMPCPLTLTSSSLSEEEHQLEAVHLLLVLHTDNNTDGNKLVIFSSIALYDCLLITQLHSGDDWPGSFGIHSLLYSTVRLTQEGR